MTERETDLVGTVLDSRYEVVRKLGEGAMGAVYLARHVRMQRMDAIKVLRDALATDREAIRRFERGARNVSAIRHPNVCTIYDYHESDGLRFMAMEFVDGPTLKDILEAQPAGALPLERAIDIAVQTAAGLDAAHDSGIVHRDLKPGNIMVEPGKGGRDVVKVVDFDIAKGTEGGEEVTRLGFVIGTPEYMSPEQLMGEPLDARSDVYSLALVLVRMLTGGLPFRAEGTQDVMLARLTSQPMRLNELRPDLHVPAALQTAIDRALQRKPADRQTDAEAFGREIRAAVTSGAPGTVAAPAAYVPATRVEPAQGKPVPPTAPPPRNRTLLYGGVGAIAVAAIAVAVFRGMGESGAPINDPIVLPPTVVDSGALPPDTTVADTGRGNDGPVVVPPPTPPPVPPSQPPDTTDDGPAPGGIRFASPAAVGLAIANLSERVISTTPPEGTALVAIRDTLMAARAQSANDGQRRNAALLLAWVAYYQRDDAACVRWADEAASLGADATTVRGYCTGAASQ